MEFSWINLCGAVIVLLMLMPNIIFAVKCKEKQTNKAGKAVTIIEQIGRYCCMVLMIIPLFVGEFGFAPLEFMFVYIILNALLLIMYYVFWALYFKNKSIVNLLHLR